MHLHQPSEQVQDAKTALQMLKDGNDRFVQNRLCDKSSYEQDRLLLVDGQKPFAVVLCCSDSRVPPEIFFDQKLGDIFVVRNAGNIVDETVLGSIEYAVEHLGCPLVVVCGHNNCGAVTAACEGGSLPPNIRSLVDHIQPAVDRGGNVDDVTRANVEIMADLIRDDDVIQHLKTTVAGAFYDLRTGVVSWL